MSLFVIVILMYNHHKPVDVNMSIYCCDNPKSLSTNCFNLPFVSQNLRKYIRRHSAKRKSDWLNSGGKYWLFERL
jgi:hypothetical protein